jgi:hypothetical protein
VSLVVTVKDQDGKAVFTRTEEYGVYDLHFPDNKQGYLGLNDWDITAMKHIDLGLEPHEVHSYTNVVPLTEKTKSVTVEAAFNYLYEKGDSAVIKTVSKKIDF